MSALEDSILCYNINVVTALKKIRNHTQQIIFVCETVNCQNMTIWQIRINRLIIARYSYFRIMYSHF